MQNNYNPELLNRLFESLDNTRTPSSFYRVLNNVLDDSKQFESTFKEKLKSGLPKIINKSKILATAQLDELLNEVASLTDG